MCVEREKKNIKGAKAGSPEGRKRPLRRDITGILIAPSGTATVVVAAAALLLCCCWPNAHFSLAHLFRHFCPAARNLVYSSVGKHTRTEREFFSLVRRENQQTRGLFLLLLSPANDISFHSGIVWLNREKELLLCQHTISYAKVKWHGASLLLMIASADIFLPP